jgi:hypothetical protein
MTNHSITPPPELVQQLCDSAALSRSFKNISIREVDVLLILEAFEAGAAQELEACVEWFQEFYKTESWVKHDLKHFRAARRPKPSSLKEQALMALEVLPTPDGQVTLDITDLNTIRRALEALPND